MSEATYANENEMNGSAQTLRAVSSESESVVSSASSIECDFPSDNETIDGVGSFPVSFSTLQNFSVFIATALCAAGETGGLVATAADIWAEANANNIDLASSLRDLLGDIGDWADDHSGICLAALVIGGAAIVVAAPVILTGLGIFSTAVAGVVSTVIGGAWFAGGELIDNASDRSISLETLIKNFAIDTAVYSVSNYICAGAGKLTKLVGTALGDTVGAKVISLAYGGILGAVVGFTSGFVGNVVQMVTEGDSFSWNNVCGYAYAGAIAGAGLGEGTTKFLNTAREDVGKILGKSNTVLTHIVETAAEAAPVAFEKVSGFIGNFVENTWFGWLAD